MRALLLASVFCSITAHAWCQSDVRINEFVANHAGSDVNEYIELFGAPNTDYTTLTVLAVEGDAGTTQGIIDHVFPVGTTNPDGFWATAFFNGALENGTLALLLVKAFTGQSGDDLDANDDGQFDLPVPWIQLVDAVAVTDGGAGDQPYASVVLTPGFDGDSRTPGGASRLPDGNDTNTVDDWTRNHFEGEGLPALPNAPMAPSGVAVNTPGTTNRPGFTPPPPPPPPGLLLNEVDVDTPGSDTREFIELYDGGTGNTPLDDLTIVLFNGTSDRSYRAIDLDGFHTDEEGLFVLGNADVSPDLIFPNSTLQNGPDAVALYAGDADDFPNGTPVTTNYLVDALVYGTDDPDFIGLLALLQPHEVQVNENATGNKDDVSMQRLPNGAGAPRTTSTFRPSVPTPGGVNGGADLDLRLYVISVKPNGPTMAATLDAVLTNRGPATAHAVTVAVHTGERVDHIEATPTNGAFDLQSGLWSIPALTAGRQATLRLNITAPTTEQLFYRAEVIRSSTPDPDSRPGDGRGDDADVATLGQRALDRRPFVADLHLSLSLTPATTVVGDTVTVTFTVINDGPSTTSGVVIESIWPDGLTYLQHTSIAPYDPSMGRWIVDQLPVGASAKLEVMVVIDHSGSFPLFAEVAENHLPDPNSATGNGHAGEDDEANVVIQAGETAGKRDRMTTFAFGPAYPNPFHGEVIIPFRLAEPTHVTLAVYDVLGRNVETLVSAYQAAGPHRVSWNARSYASGIYTLVLKAKNKLFYRRITLLK